ncbi:MAG: SMP-30/gluconolactonase/LRE family protein [Rhodospirillales bacterium]|nr:SMP-30/gluconolactonase/LRE family protein [Rhodospirillales bacterium]
MLAFKGFGGERWQFAPMGPGDFPDDLKLASDGSVWAADAHVDRFVVVGTEGNPRTIIAVPLVTSVCVGGDRRNLYIVTGSCGDPGENRGRIFRIEADLRDLALPPTRIRG